MSAKNVDKYNSFRSITVAFRVSPDIVISNVWSVRW